jgi:alkylation response protein AidB-like acyl-CoA dehydrogenase
MGHRACLSPRVSFDEVRVPIVNILGEPGDGPAILAQTFAWSGVTVALYDGGNMGMRRRLLHSLLKDPSYDPRAAVECTHT